MIWFDSTLIHFDFHLDRTLIFGGSGLIHFDSTLIGEPHRRQQRKRRGGFWMLDTRSWMLDAGGRTARKEILDTPMDAGRWRTGTWKGWRVEMLAPRSVATLMLAALICAAFVIISLLKGSAEKRKVQVGGGKKWLKFCGHVPIGRHVPVVPACSCITPQVSSRK